MQPRREVITNRLADVIHIIQFGGKSGMLSVERGEGEALEEGLITFINGQVVEANVSQQRSMAALSYLNTWRTCRFSFMASVVNNTPSSQQPMLLPTLKNNSFPASTSPANTPPFDSMVPVSQKIVSLNETASPLRLQSGEEMLKHPENNTRLSRINWRLLMLVNGQRNVGELARLMARSLGEVQELLNELERSGFIKQ